MDLGRRIASRLSGGDRTSGSPGRARQRRAEPAAHRAAPCSIWRRRRSATAIARWSSAAGPSLRRRRVSSGSRGGFTGTIVAVDGAIGAACATASCPDLVVTLDPHRERSCAGSAIRADGARRGRLLPPPGHGPDHRDDEVRPTRAAGAARAPRPAHADALATSAAPAVVDRARQAGMTLYWWNPMYDDPDVPDSVSRRLHE